MAAGEPVRQALRAIFVFDVRIVHSVDAFGELHRGWGVCDKEHIIGHYLLPISSGKKDAGLSRLDSFIRRMSAQRECLNKAFGLVADQTGLVVELGLGNGRTYDHIRENLPTRRIVVFERDPRAHPKSTPSLNDLVVGSLEETLPKFRKCLDQPVILLHSDIGCGDPVIDKKTANLICRFLPEIMAHGGIVLSDQELICDGFEKLDLPFGIAEGRYFFLRKTKI